MFKLCYVSAFLDLKRDNWSQFQRTTADYFKSFQPMLDQLEKTTDPRYHLVLFIDRKHSSAIPSLPNLTKIEIDEDWLSTNSVLWKRLPRETEIVNSDRYKQIITSANRSHFPEHSNPRYTLINHAKIDFVNYAIQMKPDCYYFAWVDFGYFARPERVPDNLLDISKFNLQTVNYTLINPITSQDSDILYTLVCAPERIGGFFFFGNRNVLNKYQQLYHAVHSAFQNAGIVDDDQHIALQCYFHCPELFTLHNLGGWHKALTHFQGQLLQPSLTEIMNRNGSDKGSGHHNYTDLYDRLFRSIREEKMNILEIGIGTNNPTIPSSMCGTPGGYKPGSSLRGWAEYFCNSNIFGCDIDKDILFKENRIETFYLDQTDSKVIQEQIVDRDRIYDIIIDDGLHRFDVNWSVLKQIFCKLKPNGYYIIEDILDFNPNVYTDSFMQQIEFRYIKVPNAKNPADNNIVVARWKGQEITEK